MVNNKPILLIEDDEIDVMSLKKAFQKLDIANEIVHANNGEKGLELLKSSEYEFGLVILDLNMPIMNGMECLDELNKQPELKMVPIIVLSTSNNINDRMMAYERKVAGYFIKSMDFKEFLSIVESWKNYWGYSLPPVE